MLPRLHPFLALSILLLTLSPGSAASAEKPMPLTMNPDAEGDPRWISIEHLNANAEELYANGHKGKRLKRRVLEELQEAEAGRCLSEWTAGRPFPGFSTLEEALEGADFVLVAVVSGVSSGFNSASPGTLYRLEGIELLHGNVTTQEEHFFRDKHIDTEFQGKRLCRKNEGTPPSPEIGDQVVILRKSPEGWFTSKELSRDLGLVREGELILLRADGSVYHPRSYQVAHPEWQVTDAAEFISWMPAGAVRGSDDEVLFRNRSGSPVADNGTEFLGDAALIADRSAPRLEKTGDLAAH